MNLARRTVTLRGYLGRDVEVSGEPYVVLALLIESAISDKATGLHIARTTQIPVVCSTPDYSCAHSHLKEGDYIEVEGVLCLCEEDGPVVWSRDPRVMRVAGIKVRATHIRELNAPEARVAS
jgi:hypothetical protein